MENNIEMLVVNKKLEARTIDKLKEMGVQFFISMFAKEQRSFWNKIERTVIFTSISKEKEEELFEFCKSDLKMNEKDNGVIAQIITKRSKKMQKNDMVVVVISSGYTEMVLETLKENGSTGATIVDAKGTGANFSTFFGIDVGAEKEMILSVVDSQLTQKIVETLNNQLKQETNSTGICFTLPVENFISHTK